MIAVAIPESILMVIGWVCLCCSFLLLLFLLPLAGSYINYYTCPVQQPVALVQTAGVRLDGA